MYAVNMLVFRLLRGNFEVFAPHQDHAINAVRYPRDSSLRTPKFWAKFQWGHPQRSTKQRWGR